MANDTNYWGLRPVKHLDGSPWNGVTEKCYVGATYAPALYIGDPVTITTTDADMDATATYASVLIATLTAAYPIYGVITSFDSSDDMDDKYVKKPASTEAYVNVCVDPDVIYHIRDDGLGTPGVTWPFLNAGLIAGTDSAITGYSGTAMSGASVAATQNLQLLILRKANLPDNALLDNAVWEVLINCHQLRNGGAAGALVGSTLGIA